MYDPNITMEEYIRLEEEKVRKRGKVFNWETAKYVSSLNNEIDFRVSFDDSDDEDYTVIFDKNSFSYKMISVNDLKTDSENDNEKVNMPSFLPPEPTEQYGDLAETMICIEPANIAEALKDADWVSAMQEELGQFARLKV
ncbi:hypothetical protein Tco_0966713 [Tanacetum coccineum]